VIRVRPHTTRALLLDLDGTLALSVGVLVQVYRKFLAMRARPATDAEFARLNGPSLREVVAILKDTHRLDGTIDDLLAAYKSLVRDVYEDVEPNAGARELMEGARALDWKVCVVTSNTRDIADRWLKRVHLDGYVTDMVTGEVVTKSKPDPEIYRMALERCGVLSQNAIAVEDAPLGAASAVGAGVETYVLSDADTASASWPPAVRRITSLRDMLPVIHQHNVG
jgi:HAD superfamily hydrolase (TIGR01509 family)